MSIMAQLASSLFTVARAEHSPGGPPSIAMLALERALYCSAQDALDVAAMLLKLAGWADPVTYADSAVALADLGIITTEQSGTLVALAGLRNRLAHDYGTPERERLIGFESHMGDFDAYARSVLIHLERRGPERH